MSELRHGIRGLDVGSLLLLDHARGRAELVQLTVVSENESARSLYRATGFVEYGYEKRALKHNGDITTRF